MNDVSHVRGRSLAPYELDPGARLDAETLLAYCASQLNDLNGEIRQRMAQQHLARGARERINELRALIRTNGVYDPAQKRAILTKYAEALKATPPGPMFDRLMASLQEFRKSACYRNGEVPGPPQLDGYLHEGIDLDLAMDSVAKGNENHLDEKEIQARTDELGTISDDINRSAEIDLMGLQQLVSQRQMAIQLTTQCLAKLNQAVEAIVANVK